MGSARFGGQIDASGVLQDIYNSEIAAREALAQAGERRASEEQNALDRDAQDRWQRGQMSDDDWLAYIEHRVDLAKGFPEEVSEWRKIYRDTSEAIAVNQAEFAFQNGGSINQLIAFYQKRMKGMNRSSSAAQETLQRLNQLQDQRLSDEIARGMDSIQDRVESGELPPSAMADYLRGQIGRTRANSDMRRQVQQNLDQAEDQQRQYDREYAVEQLQFKWTSGAISGDQYAAALKGLAGEFRSDPSTYFGMLNEAKVGEQYGRFAYDGASGGSGGSGGGSRGSGPMSLGRLQDNWDDIRWRAEQITKQVMAGATEITDPGTGEKVDVSTPAGRRWLENMDRDAMRSFQAQNAIGRELNNREMSSTALDGLNSYIIGAAQPKQTMLEREMGTALKNSIEQRLAGMSNLIDPAEAERVLDRITRDVDSYISGLTTSSMTADRGETAKLTGGAQRVQGMAAPGAKPAYQQVEGETVNEWRAVSALLNADDPMGELQTILGSGATGDNRAGDVVTSDWLTDLVQGNRQQGVAGGFGGVAAVRMLSKGVEDGTVEFMVLPGLGPTPLPMAPVTQQVVDPRTGQAVLTKTMQPQFPEGYKLPDNTVSEIAVGVQVGDHVIRMRGYSTKESTPWSVWQTTGETKYTVGDGKEGQTGTIGAGKTLTDDVVAGIGDAQFQELVAAGKIAAVPFQTETFTTEQNGRSVTFTRLPGGGWVRGTLPMRVNSSVYGDPNDPNGHVDILSLDANGMPSGEYKAERVFAVPFVGSDPKTMQEAMNAGLFAEDLAQVHQFNWSTGKAADTLLGGATYWTPDDEAGRARMDQQRATWYAEQSALFDSPDYRRIGQEAEKSRWNMLVRDNREMQKTAALAQSGKGGSLLDSMVGDIAGDLGLNFGTPKAEAIQSGAQPVGRASWPTEQMPKKPALPPIRPTVGGRLPLVSNLPEPQASSGPELSSTRARTFTPSPQPVRSMGSFLPSIFQSAFNVATSPLRRTKAPPGSRYSGKDLPY